MTEGKFTYYLLNKDGTVGYAKSNENYGGKWARWHRPDQFRAAKKVWVQGPKGGTQLIRAPWYGPDKETGWNKVGYITNIPEAMSEFSWVVLAAQPINIRI